MKPCLFAAMLALLPAAVSPPRCTAEPMGDESPISFPFRERCPVSSVQYTPDGRRLLITAYRRGVQVWDARTGRFLHTLMPYTQGRPVIRAVLSPTGDTLAAWGYGGHLRLFNARTGRELRTFDAGAGGIAAVAFSPDGKHLAAGAGSPELLTHLGKRVPGHGEVTVWEIETGKPWVTLNGFDAPVTVAYSPDGRTLATASGDSVKLWDAGTGAFRRERVKDVPSIHCLAFSADGTRLAAGGVEIGPDGASVKGAFAVWDPHTGTLMSRSYGLNQPVLSLAFNRAGDTLASGDAGGNVGLWTLTRRDEPGRPLWRVEFERTLAGHGADARALAFAPDGRRLASGGRDGTVKLWDLSREEWRAALMPLPDDGSAPDPSPRSEWVAYTPEGDFDASPGALPLLRWREGEGWEADPQRTRERHHPERLRDALKRD